MDKQIFTEDERFCISNILDTEAREGNLKRSEITKMCQALEKSYTNVLHFTQDELRLILKAIRNDLKVLKSLGEYNGENVDLRYDIIRRIERKYLKDSKEEFFESLLIK